MAKKPDSRDTSYIPPVTGFGGHDRRFHSVSWDYCARLYGDAWQRVANHSNHPKDDEDYLRWHSAMMRLCRHALKTLNGELTNG